MEEERSRLRALGFVAGRLEPGELNALTDVPGVRVGHRTLTAATGSHPDVCTGVTAIVAGEGDLRRAPLRAAAHVINGFGKTAGLVQVAELGELETPILLTNTFAIGAALEGGLRWLMARDPDVGPKGPTPNVVVGECNDGYLNDLRRLAVRPEHAGEAIEAATGGPVAEGAVGAGAGTVCCGWKGGIGTASRRVPGTPCTVGVLVQSNFGRADDLTVLGRRVGEVLHPQDFLPPDGSIMMIVATDLPWDALSLRRLAARTAFGLGRLGASAGHGSGDIAIAFSTAREGRPGHLDGGAAASAAFHAVAEATEEAVLNSLTMATTTRGRAGRVVPALPLARVTELLAAR